MNTRLLSELYDQRSNPLALPREDVADALPAGDSPTKVDERSFLGLLELLLKHPGRIDRLAGDESRLAELIPRFLAVVLVSFSVFALALVLVLNQADPSALPPFLQATWTGGFRCSVSLWSAYTLGLVAASGVCLPTFYFFGLLAGVRASPLQVTGHIMKGKASTAVMLLGILPIYVAVVLGMVVLQVRPESLREVLYLGLLLPFVAGFWGAWSIYRGFLTMADTLPACRRERRTCFLRRLTVAWGLVYSVVTPVMIWTLWNYFIAHLG